MAHLSTGTEAIRLLSFKPVKKGEPLVVDPVVTTTSSAPFPFSRSPITEALQF